MMILEQLLRKVTKNHQKSIGKTVFSQRVFATSKNLINPTENMVFEKSKTRCANPYKTCLKLMISEPKSQNGLQNDPKSIRFIDKSHMAFHHVDKPYKNLSKMESFERPFSAISTFWSNFPRRVWGLKRDCSKSNLLPFLNRLEGGGF